MIRALKISKFENVEVLKMIEVEIKKIDKKF